MLPDDCWYNAGRGGDRGAEDCETAGWGTLSSFDRLRMRLLSSGCGAIPTHTLRGSPAQPLP